MSSVQPRILRGFRDYLSTDMQTRERMLQDLGSVFQRFGYLPLMTPALEYSDILLGKYGDEGDSLLYRFEDNGGRDVALRYDLTVPLARVVAQYPELPRPFRRYQMAPVWRAEKPARGRFREFYQCDGDIVGSASMLADAEVIQVGAEMLDSLGVERFEIRVNNRKILSGLMESIGVAPGPDEMGVLRTIDKLPKIGPEATRDLLARENGLEAARIDRVFEFLDIQGSSSEVLGRLAEIFEAGSTGSRGRGELGEVLEITDALGLSGRIAVDLSIARGLNYYNGTIYETFLADLPGFGAVMSGGRYDGLIGTFAREEIPAVGISLGIDRLLAGLKELELIRDPGAPARVLVTIFDADSISTAARLAQRVRQAGIACELYPQPAKLKKQLKYAERQEKRFALIQGSEEIERGAVQVKDLAAREQQEVELSRLGDYLAAKLGSASRSTK